VDGLNLIGFDLPADAVQLTVHQRRLQRPPRALQRAEYRKHNHGNNPTERAYLCTEIGDSLVVRRAPKTPDKR